jgi:hypothetical protein
MSITSLRSYFRKRRKEFEALKAAGVEVKIEQVEHIIVLKPKSKRGSYRPPNEKI